jgi:phospholipase C
VRLFPAAIALALLVSLGATSGSTAPAPLRPPVDASRFETRFPIKHVIFIIKENRSFDQYFGLFPGANGATTGRTEDGVVPLVRGLPNQLPHDLMHQYPTSLASIDHGRMDGFGYNSYTLRHAYTQAVPSDIPAYWHWAEQFVLGDYFFASAQGPSFPNHLYAIAAQSGGTHGNPGRDLSDPRAPKAGPLKTWGCDAPSWERLRAYDTEGNWVWVPPCFDFATEADLLDKAGVPWAYYATPPYQKGYIWSAFAAVRHIRESGEWQEHVRSVDWLTGDIRRGALPPVTWVTPRFALSEHPEQGMCQGENWTVRVVNAVMRSEMWKDTAIFITWDDWGGFYDHEPPPQIDGFGLGIRVPLLLISPYARRGYIDHRPAEFSSVLRFIEDNWGLTQLTHRDRRADDMAHDFSFGSPPRPPDPLPPRKDCPTLTTPPGG